MNRVSFSVVALFVLAASTATAQVVRPGIIMPPRDVGAAAPEGTGRIRGRVLMADGGAPLRRAQVMIISQEVGIRRMTTTDANGRYEFARLPAGQYNITASKGGYVTLQVGQRRPFEPGTPVRIADGQTLNDVDAALPRGGVIGGRVTDEFGEPLAGAQVQALRYQYMPGGRRELSFAGGPFVMTDDLGQFRVYGLMPGEYVVSAALRQPGMALGPGSTTDTSEGYAPTYYPNTPNAAEAQPVIVGLSQESSVHIALAAARMARVSGTVVDSTGRPASGGMVFMRSSSGGGMMMSMLNGQVASDGAFSIANVPPGEHTIEVRPQPRGPDAPVEFASTPITVGNKDITSLRITMGPGVTVRGQVVFEGTAPRTGGFGPLRITTQSADPNGGPMGMMMAGPNLSNGVVADDGTFEIGGVTGRIFFRAATPPAWTLKSVTVAGENVTDVPFDMRGAGTLSDVRVVLTNRVSEITGAVTDERGQPVKDFVVVVLPEEEKEGMAATRYIRAARPDQEGRYRARYLPPGRYLATAVQSLEQGQEWDPELQGRLRDAARAVTVNEGQAVTLELKLTKGM